VWAAAHGGIIYSVAVDPYDGTIVAGGVRVSEITTRKFNEDGDLLWSVDHGDTVFGVAYDINVPPPQPLRNIRSISLSSGVRLRCDLDPTIRPGDTVQGAGYEFVVAYINAYANDSDRYMDVGERPL
jgi:hypothetical protein